jgi:hypothetical protein
MIRSKRELEAVAAQWTARAKEDLRNQMIAFIEANGTNEAELADALSISLNEIDQILNGNGEISLSTFAKLLIATDNVIEIKPAAVMRQQFGGRMPHAPQGGYPVPPMGREMPQGRTPQGRRPMPQRGDMPFPPMGEGMPMPPMEGFPFPPMGEEMPQAPRFGGMPGMSKRMKKASQPNRLPNGRFAPKNQPQVQCVRLDELELDELGKNELLDIIRQNHWDSEIHAEAKRGELIEFLNWKIENQDASEMNEAPQDDENAKIARMLAEEVARNPHLKEMVKKYL